MPSGGYRKPANPAPVAGPGSLSRRTDGGPADKQPVRDLPNPDYGEQAEFRGIQQSAPLQKVQAPRGAAPSAAAGTLPPPLDAPSARPDEPVTYGAPVGPGAGPEVLGLLDDEKLAMSDMTKLLRYLPTLQYIADTDPDTSLTTRALVRYLRSQV